MTQFAISVDHVNKSFHIPHVEHQSLRGRILHPFAKTRVEQFDALHDVTFNVEHGEFFGIVGRNGSGKSTLLKVIAGIYKPDSGTVTVNGAVAPFIELGVGFNPELSGRDNVFINGALLGLSRARIEERYDAIVDFAELHRFMDLKLRNFSSGMQVRLAFAIALEAGAEILLTDEVLAVGDENFQRKCFDVFRERKEQGRTVIFVTHDMGAILDFCDRTLLLDHGRMVALGDTREIVRKYHQLNAAGRDALDSDDQDSTLDGHSSETRITGVDLLADGGPAPEATVAAGGRIGFRIVASIADELVEPIVGLIITDHLGKQVLLTNTLWTPTSTGLNPAGTELITTFSFDNVLGAGDYTVRAEIAEAGPGPVIHSLRDALRFTVTSPIETGGAVDLPVDISVEHVAAEATSPASA